MPRTTILVLTQLPDRASAQVLARSLIEARLAACVTIGASSDSLYHWRGKIETAEEVPIIVKFGDIDWKNKGRFENKNIYFSHIVGDCYQIALQYNEQLKALNVSINILAFPSRAINLNLGGQGPLVPTSLNF